MGGAGEVFVKHAILSKHLGEFFILSEAESIKRHWSLLDVPMTCCFLVLENLLRIIQFLLHLGLYQQRSPYRR
jgi:hypothetical protein